MSFFVVENPSNILIGLIAVCFKVFDVDSDGVLNVDEIKDMINILIFVSKENSSSNSNSKNHSYEQVLHDLQNRTGKPSTTEVCVQRLKTMNAFKYLM